MDWLILVWWTLSLPTMGILERWLPNPYRVRGFLAFRTKLSAKTSLCGILVGQSVSPWALKINLGRRMVPICCHIHITHFFKAKIFNGNYFDDIHLKVFLSWMPLVGQGDSKPKRNNHLRDSFPLVFHKSRKYLMTSHLLRWIISHPTEAQLHHCSPLIFEKLLRAPNKDTRRVTN